MSTLYQAPADHYTPTLPSDPDADLHLTHTHEHGTQLTGGRPGDGTLDILRTAGFIYRSGSVHVPATRDRFAPLDQIRRAAEALREAGHRVTVTIDDRWRPAAVREADRATRAGHRATRLDQRAGRQAEQAATRHAAAQRITDWLGDEPVKAGHHSEARHLNAYDRAERHRDAAQGHSGYARHLESRAAGARGNEQAKHNPRAITRRVEALEAEARHWQRQLDDRDDRRATLELEKIREDIAHQRGKLAALEASEQFVPWGPAHFRPGDRVNVYGMWCPVHRVNTKTVGVNVDGASQRVTWDKVHGRRRDGLQWDTPHGHPAPAREAIAATKWDAVVAEANRTPHQARSEHVRQALRAVLRLPAEAGEPEVAAFPEPDTVAQRRALAAVCWSLFRRLERGETFAQVAVNPPPVELPEPGWRMPTGTGVDRLADQLRPGDVVKGIYVRRFGPAFGQAPRELDRSVGGPVLEVGQVYDRREAGRWCTVTLAAGPDGDPVRCEFKDCEWLAVYPVEA